MLRKVLELSAVGVDDKMLLSLSGLTNRPVTMSTTFLLRDIWSSIVNRVAIFPHKWTFICERLLSSNVRLTFVTLLRSYTTSPASISTPPISVRCFLLCRFDMMSGHVLRLKLK